MNKNKVKENWNDFSEDEKDVFFTLAEDVVTTKLTDIQYDNLRVKAASILYAYESSGTVKLPKQLELTFK